MRTLYLAESTPLCDGHRDRCFVWADTKEQAAALADEAFINGRVVYLHVAPDNTYLAEATELALTVQWVVSKSDHGYIVQ